MSRSDRLYRLLLRAYPRATRDGLGRDMAQLFADQLRDAGGSPRSISGVWLRTVVDTLRTAASDRFAAGRRRVVEGPSIEERRRSWLRDMALASLPSLGLLLLWAQPSPSVGPPLFDPSISEPMVVAMVAPLAAGQWLAALRAVRARTAVRWAGWAVVWALCVVGIVLGPALVLIATNFRWAG